MLAVKRKEAVLDLDGGDGVHGVRAADGGSGAFGQADVADLSFSVVRRPASVLVAHAAVSLTHCTSSLRAPMVSSMGTSGSGL